MPVISTFYGITIHMFYKDHEPPHIHAEYAGQTEVIDIRNGRVIRGQIPRRAHKMVIEWWELYQDELAEIWETNQRNKKLPPLV